MLEKTYIIEKGPPPPSAENYRDEIQREWQDLLDTADEEAPIQAFLERNPMFLPGAWTPGTKSGHYPLHCAAISQPVLPGLKSKKPDFMWISKHSQAWYPTLIEIEKPSKNLFGANGKPTSEFYQARNQLAEWRTWFSKPENVNLFNSEYGISSNFRIGRQMYLHMILIYGRRAEFENDPRLAEQRASLLPGNDEELMSFDRLRPDAELEEAITVKATGSGTYEALHVPPVFFLRPALATRLRRIQGIAEAVRNTPLISEARRAFLISRIPYWQDWATNRKAGVYDTGDRE